MARIRSIKPEFWSDGKIAKLSHSAALFFIGLWNFCDDEGKFSFDPIQLSLRMPIFRSKDILTWLRMLSEECLIQVSEGSEWGLVANWKHQRINRPIPTKIKNEDIRWLPLGHSLSEQKSSVSTHRKDRIGKDRIGKDRISSEGGASTPPSTGLFPDISRPEKAPKEKAPTSETWNAYSDAYSHRYGVAPTRNATVNGQLANFVKRLGQEEAPSVAAFYLTHGDSFYLKSMHPVSLMVRDAEKLRTEWVTGQKMTSAKAKNSESVDYAQDQLRRIQEGTL